MYSFRFSVLTTVIVCAFLASLFPLASIAVAADNITISAEYGPPDTANTWQKFTIPLTADTFDTDASTFNQVMSSVTQFRIRTEMHNGHDWGALDDVSIGNQYSSNFNSSLEGWSAAGDGTMEWVPTGGTSGGYLQISDWATGDWHWAVAPPNWSGNWSNLIGSSISFYMKTNHPSYSAIIEIKSDDSQWLTLSADPMLVPPGGTSIVTVTPNPVPAQQLSVSLNSSDTGCITVPSSMTIGAGQLGGQFIATAAPGADIECESVIKVSASGYTNSLITLNIGEVPDSGGDGDIGLSCSDGDNEEGGCCCFHGEHTYMFDPVCVSSVTVKFDTGRGLGCQSNVEFQVYDGSLWSDVGQYQAVSSSGGSELYVIETEVPVGQTVSGFKISDGCTCCIDSSSIVLHTASASDGNDCDSKGTTGSGDSGGSGGGPDSDGDGIPDSQDQCPNTPANTSVGSDGCPSAAASANLVVESRTVTPGNQVTVPVKLQNVSDVASLNFNISYNAGLVKVIRVDKGSLLSGIAFVANTNESGIIRFGFATENYVDGTGPIGHIVFEAIGSAGSSSPLTVSGVEATNSSGNSISLSTQNGTVTISGNRIPGDYNGDGLVTELDALAALRMSVKLLAEDLILDMDQNGRVTAEDARRILSIAVRGS